MPDVCHQVVELVGDAEEVRAVDFIDSAAFRNDEVLLVDCHIRGVAKVYFILDDRDFGGLHDALHEEGAGQDEADLNRDGEVEDNRQEEGHAKHDDVALRVLQQASNRAPAAHIVSHDDEYCGQRSHRNILGIRHQEKQDGKQHDGMDDACNRCLTSVVDVRHGARDGSRCWNASEKRRHHVRHTLCNKFHVRVVLVADNTVCHRC